VHKINPDINVMCELHITGKLYTAACSLSDADSGFEKKLGTLRKKKICSVLQMTSTILSDFSQ
jgi:hypothetical protein